MDEFHKFKFTGNQTVIFNISNMNSIINITIEVNYFNVGKGVGNEVHVFHFKNHFATTNEIQPLLKKLYQ